MSYKSRGKKRRRKIAIVNNKGRADRWYLTPVRKHCCCNRCGTSLRAGVHDMVFRYTPKEILCQGCADTERVSYRPSKRWDDSKQRELDRRAAA